MFLYCHIILADEPTGNLDSKSATEIASLLKEVSKDKLVIVVIYNFLHNQRKHSFTIMSLRNTQWIQVHIEEVHKFIKIQYNRDC